MFFGDCDLQKNKLFSTRSAICFFIVLLLLLSCALRVVVVATGNYNLLQEEQASYTIEIVQNRGAIYDCNMVPITNSKSKIIAAVSPNERSIDAIKRVLNANDFDKVIKTLNENKPVVCEVDKDILCAGIATTTVYERYSDNYVACHLIGYVDENGHGVSGLELAYDDILYSDKYLTAKFACDGKGNVLKGIEPKFENDVSNGACCVVSTIDINIQNIVEKEIANMNSGCVIVAEVENSKIRAMASAPKFDVNNIYASLNDLNSPMINRALYTYNVGSVFKPCVAASVLESKLSDLTFNCEGSVEIGNQRFRCHNLEGHGNMNLCSSLAKSCNCFFYNCAIILGGEEMYKKAAMLSLNGKIKIADNLYTKAGSLPQKDELLNAGAIANMSIGQGKMMASPIAMLNLYVAIAGNGSYFVPSVVEETIKHGKKNAYNIGNPTKIMESDTAQTLREYLKTVITDGTGSDASPTGVTAAGKTATAQTGRYYEDKTEITNSWFCGFFPADNPKYAVVVMSDSKLKVSTASVFAKIADAVAEYKGINGKNND